MMEQTFCNAGRHGHVAAYIEDHEAYVRLKKENLLDAAKELGYTKYSGSRLFFREGLFAGHGHFNYWEYTRLIKFRDMGIMDLDNRVKLDPASIDTCYDERFRNEA